MTQIALFHNLQHNLWKMIEMVLNSQRFTLGAIKTFEALKSSCYNELRNFNINSSSHLKNPFETISFLYRNYLNVKSDIRSSSKQSTILIDKQIELSLYNGETHTFLRKIKHHCEEKLSPYMRGDFIHGSLATLDYTDFSDVDVGLIVKNEVMLSPEHLKELKRSLKSALKIILKFDNLQHHGFFIIPEGFLINYPKDYLPEEVFAYSKSLSKPFRLKIREYEQPDYAREKFANMAKTIIRKTSNPPRNLYDLKLFLSQFMLLPTLYLQAKGIYEYKKFSFEIVRKEFPEDWWVIDEASKIRNDWIRPNSTIFKTLLDTSPNPWLAPLIYKKLYWRIPNWVSNEFNDKFYKGIKNLSNKMMSKTK